jgi:hypothetical protein
MKEKVLIVEDEFVEANYIQLCEGLPDPAASSATLDEVERRHIIEVLRKCNGKVGGKGGDEETGHHKT